MIFFIIVCLLAINVALTMLIALDIARWDFEDENDGAAKPRGQE